MIPSLVNSRSNSNKVKWFAISAILLLVWTLAAHLAWSNHKSILHGVPAFFLGLAILLVAQATVRIGSASFRLGRAWLFSRFPLAIVGWTTLFLTATLALFYSLELWRGKYAWAAMAREAAQAGETLRLQDAIAGAVPDADNFASAACFHELVTLNAAPTNRSLGRWAHVAYWEKWPELKTIRQAPWLNQEFTDFKACLQFWRGWQTNVADQSSTFAIEQPIPDLNEFQMADLVLRSLAPFEDQIEQVRAASTRPHSRFPLNYSRQMFEPNPYSSVLNGMTRILRVRASAEIATGRTRQAFEDTQLALRLCQLSSDQPWPMSDEQRLVTQIDAIQPVWEGLAKRQWNETQIRQLQSALERLAPMSGLPASARLASFGMAGFCEAIIPTSNRPSEVLPMTDAGEERVLSIARLLYPRGWSLQDQAAIHRERIRVLHEPFGQPTTLLDSSSDPFYPIFIVPRAVMMLRENEMFYMAQAAADLAAIGCALEIHRVQKGAYPTSLGELVPAQLTSLPLDPLTNRALAYHLVDPNAFILYSVGGNQQDDGGKTPRDFTDPAQRFLVSRAHQGDWVWTYPTN